MKSFEGINIDLEQKNYRIVLENNLNIGVSMKLRRDKAGVKDHGSIFLSEKDIDALIEGLQYMKDNLKDDDEE